ncbi:alpha/beta fold hydrolase [Actinacidiphila acidipaludis]|uniref:Alpha/beta fold hydrolase n=1 Tax=Actinacidiphila acidipaludis TaxID=2873382 RepID=A0ABS7QD57_9ACTN|nr:alpha/beta fold hydrolase [Streptomyces acidipaludis]MBY8881067.1 alpha/beta fold hydrolase [Streptomyces acidipaludis]
MTTENSPLPLEAGDLHVRQDGPRDAPALVLVHGLAASTSWWDAIVPELAAARHVVRLDLLGHGRSARPDGPGYRIADHARRVGAALDRLGVEQAVAIGHSTGGLVVTALAEERPGLLGALALIDTGPRLGAFVSNGLAGRLMLAPGLGSLLWRVRTDALIRKALSTAFSRPGYEIPPHLVADVRTMTLHGTVATSQGAIDYLTRQPLPDRLSALGKPLLVLFGEQDRRWRPSSAAEYTGVPGALVEMIPGVGHSPMLEDPHRTLALLRPFIEAHARG